jgi:hypothetical protein
MVWLRGNLAQPEPLQSITSAFKQCKVFSSARDEDCASKSNNFQWDISPGTRLTKESKSPCPCGSDEKSRGYVSTGTKKGLFVPGIPFNI